MKETHFLAKMDRYKKSTKFSHHAVRTVPTQLNLAPLPESRFKTLLASASAFFSASERDMEAEKTAAIEEILSLMAKYSLTLDDIQG